MSEQIERFMTYLDRIATIKAGIMSSGLAGGIAILKGVDWLAILGAVTAIVTIVAQINRIIMEHRKDRREHTEHLERIRGEKD